MTVSQTAFKLARKVLHPRIRSAVNIILDRVPAKRETTVFAGDTFVVSYPRSGNTWFRFVVANLLDPQSPASFSNIEERVPDIYKNTDSRLRRMPRPRVLKSHEPFTPQYRRVVYLVRDPRDVAVSYYHYFVKIRVFEEGYSFSTYLERFIQGDLDEFGAWSDHVGSWLGARATDPDFLMIRYEDLLEDTAAGVRRTAAFLGIDASDERIAHVVDLSNADRMSKLEKVEGQSWATTKGSRSDKAFVRKATRDTWKSELQPGQAEIIERAWGDRMRTLGYLA